jgi:hypothetical protein
MELLLTIAWVYVLGALLFVPILGWADYDPLRSNFWLALAFWPILYPIALVIFLWVAGKKFGRRS